MKNNIEKCDVCKWRDCTWETCNRDNHNAKFHLILLPDNPC